MDGQFCGHCTTALTEAFGDVDPGALPEGIDGIDIEQLGASAESQLTVTIDLELAEPSDTDGGLLTDGGVIPDRGLTTAALPYQCRVCRTESKVLVNTQANAAGEYVVDGHRCRLWRGPGTACDSERVHVAAVDGMDAPHPDRPIDSRPEASDE